MSTAPLRPRTAPTSAAIVIALGLGALVAAILLARPPAAALGDGPSEEAFKELERVRKALVEAEKHADKDKKFQDALRDADQSKLDFVQRAFENSSLFGRCAADEVIIRLDRIDTFLEDAKERVGKGRSTNLDRARKQAKELDELLDACAPEASAAHSLAVTIRGHILRLEVQDGLKKLSDKELGETADDVTKLKRQMLRGQTIDGCDVLEFFVLIERIDILIVRAYATGPADFKEDGERKSTRKRRDLAEEATSEVKKLTRTYRLIPCGEEAPPGLDGGDAPPPSPPPGGGGGTPPPPPPPPRPPCDNGADDDGDGSADHGGASGMPKDEACLSPQDTTEEHTSWPVGLPGDGGSNTNHIDFKPNFSDTPPEVQKWAVFYNPTLHESSDPNQPPTPISGTGPCDPPPDTLMEIDSGIGAQAPTTSPMGTPLPPVPDANHMRIVLDTDDMPGGDACNGTVGLRIATDTR